MKKTRIELLEKLVRFYENKLSVGEINSAYDIKKQLSELKTQVEVDPRELTDEEIKKQGMIEEGLGDKYFVGIHYNNDWISGAKAMRDNKIK